VIINLEEIKKTTKYIEIFQMRQTPTEIFYFLLVHGLLHLVGYDDETEVARQEMLRRGANFLNVFRKGRKKCYNIKD
jgi:ssRNA-specific RNase YbeY (16S rRNA maturation enzyme)